MLQISNYEIERSNENIQVRIWVTVNACMHLYNTNAEIN